MMFQGRHFQNAYITRDHDNQSALLNAQGVTQHMITEAGTEPSSQFVLDLFQVLCYSLPATRERPAL